MSKAVRAEATLFRWDLVGGELWAEPDDRAGLSEWALPAYVPEELQSIFKDSGTDDSTEPVTSPPADLDALFANSGTTPAAGNFSYEFNDPEGPDCWLAMKKDQDWIFDNTLMSLYHHMKETNWFQEEPKIKFTVFQHCFPYTLPIVDEKIEKDVLDKILEKVNEELWATVDQSKCSHLAIFVNAMEVHWLWVLLDLDSGVIYYYEGMKKQEFFKCPETKYALRALATISKFRNSNAPKETPGRVEPLRNQGNCGLHVIHQVEKAIEKLKIGTKGADISPEILKDLRQGKEIPDFNENPLSARLAMRYLLYSEEARKSRIGAFCDSGDIPPNDNSVRDDNFDIVSKVAWIPKAYDPPLSRPQPGPDKRFRISPFGWNRGGPSKHEIGDFTDPRVVNCIHQYLQADGTHGVLVKWSDQLTSLKKSGGEPDDLWERYASEHIKPFKFGQKIVAICYRPNTKVAPANKTIKDDDLAFMIGAIKLPNGTIRTLAKIGVTKEKDKKTGKKSTPSHYLTILLNGFTRLERCQQAFLPELVEFEVTVNPRDGTVNPRNKPRTTYFYWFQRYEVAFPEGGTLRMDYEEVDRRTWWELLKEKEKMDKEKIDKENSTLEERKSTTISDDNEIQMLKAKLAFHLGGSWVPHEGHDPKGAHTHHHHMPSNDSMNEFKYRLCSYIFDKEGRFPWGDIPEQERNVDSLIKRLQELIAVERKDPATAGLLKTYGHRCQKLLDIIYLGLYQILSWPDKTARPPAIQCFNPRCLEVSSAFKAVNANYPGDILCNSNCRFRKKDCPAACTIDHRYPITFDELLPAVKDDYKDTYAKLVSSRPPSWWCVTGLGDRLPGYKSGRLEQWNLDILKSTIALLEARSQLWIGLVNQNHHLYVYNYDDFYSKLEIRLANDLNCRFAAARTRRSDDNEAITKVKKRKISGALAPLSGPEEFSKSAIWVTDTIKTFEELADAYRAWVKAKIVECRREELREGEAEAEARRRRRRLFY